MDEKGRKRLVRHGFLPEREVMTGIGRVQVQVPRVRDRGADPGTGRIRFRSSIVPPYLRKAKSVEELLAWLQLKGISTGDFGEALAALLGPDAEGLPVSMPLGVRTSTSGAKGICQPGTTSNSGPTVSIFKPRLDEDWQCMLVIIGTDEYGEKDILAIMDGFRENAESWRDLQAGPNARGLAQPELAIGDGAPGFWTALRDVYPGAREQRCWVHKAANVTGTR